jgi:heat shock protein HslJ
MNNSAGIIQKLAVGIATFTVGSVSIAIALPAAAQQPSTTTPIQMAQSPSPIIGSWRLTNMTMPGSPMPMLPAAETPLTAEFEGDRVAGSGGCNRFFGGFQAQGQRLTISQLGSTNMACEPAAVMSQEANYLQALQGAQRYEVTPQGLTIYYRVAQGEGVLRYVAEQSAPQGSQSTPQTRPTQPTQPTQPTTPPQSSEPVRALW